jgi:hypothetical protein
MVFWQLTIDAKRPGCAGTVLGASAGLSASASGGATDDLARARRDRHDDPEDPIYAVVMHDPEGNEFCVS